MERILLRIPAELKEKIVQYADSLGLSMNDVLKIAIKQFIHRETN